MTGRALDDDALRRALIPVDAPEPVRPRVRRRAAIAVVLRRGPEGDEIALMRRTERPGDPWSGDVCLPGGFVDADDASVLVAAVRETREELALDLGGAEPLGRLPTRPGPPWDRWTNFAVTPLVFRFSGDPTLTPEAGEVVSARWIPVARLRDPDAHEHFWWTFRPWRRVPLPLPFRMRRVVVDDYDVWGLTFDALETLWAALDRS